ncbi:MAG TPA: SRPBCC family protein [Acidimicrobiales bacterium]|nr:SRPBCC family protein [Acidimicrobiales bacterium]
MDLTGDAELSAPPERVFAEVYDLGTYPSWLGIVHGAQPVESDGDAGPAWMVDLGARIGPVQQTKRVRMVRTDARPPGLVRFERRELDGRSHSAWVLAAEVAPRRGGSVLTMHVHYGGAPSLPFLERLLADEIRKAGERLEQRLSTPGH